jgi:prepilin-type N-terminal cleavage/methylation domain-containing protein
MKNKKGFTLIELLAVIVILAIIALIATPTVLSAIGDARTRANKESARAYVSALEYYCATQLTASPTATAPTFAAAVTAVNTPANGLISGSTVTVVSGNGAFDSDCKVVRTASTATFNGFSPTALDS